MSISRKNRNKNNWTGKEFVGKWIKISRRGSFSLSLHNSPGNRHPRKKQSIKVERSLGRLFFDRFLKGKAEFSGFNPRLRDKWGCASTIGRFLCSIVDDELEWKWQGTRSCACYKIGNFSKTARRRPREKQALRKQWKTANTVNWSLFAVKIRDESGSEPSTDVYRNRTEVSRNSISISITRILTFSFHSLLD